MGDSPACTRGARGVCVGGAVVVGGSAAAEGAADKEDGATGRALRDGGEARGEVGEKGTGWEVVVSGRGNERGGAGEQATSGGLD